MFQWTSNQVYASLMWFLPFWFGPWIVKIFTNIFIMVPSLSCSTKFLFKWHFNKYQGCLLTSIKKKKSLVQTTLLTAFYRVSLPQSWQTKLAILILVLGKDGQNHALDLTLFTQTLFSSAKKYPLLFHVCSVPATWPLTEKEQILEHHFPRWGISISFSKWGNCWCRKSLNKKASPSNALMKGHIPWQWNEEASNHYKGAPSQGKICSFQSSVPVSQFC